MSTRVAHVTIQHVLTAASRLDVTLPKDIVKSATDFLELEQKVRGYARNANHVSVADTILDSLAEGADPYDDAVVQEALRHAEVASRAEGVAIACYRRADAFLAQRAADILAAFKPAVARAGVTLAAAVEKLGDIDFEDAKTILSRGGDAAQTWAEARTAESAVAQVLTVRSYLQGVQGSGIRNPGQYRPLILAEIPAAQFLSNYVGQDVPTGWALVRGGLTLSLASPVELENRIAAINGERQEIADKQSKAAANAWQRSGSFSGVPA